MKATVKRKFRRNRGCAGYYRSSVRTFSMCLRMSLGVGSNLVLHTGDCSGFPLSKASQVLL